GNTTREEAIRVQALLQPKGVRTILLVTNAGHLARARPLFERVGFAVHPVPRPGARRLALLSGRRIHLDAGGHRMEATFIAALTGLTSIGAYYFGARALGLSTPGRRAAIGH